MPSDAQLTTAKLQLSSGSRRADPVVLTPRREALGPQQVCLPDGRWHFHHGPIDLIIGADGQPEAVTRSIEAAWARFETILSELVSELRSLRSPVQGALSVQGAVAQRMVAACRPHLPAFVTPMAAVAGAVADEIIEFFRAEADIRRAYVNNGGDIAVHLLAGMSYRVGMVTGASVVAHPALSALAGALELSGHGSERGIATSGWCGRSFSMGIADSVTVLATSAAVADVAATLLGNAVNVDDPAILRKPACQLKDDTDLGERLVTVAVGPLAPVQIEAALAHGERAARSMQDRGLLRAAVLCLQGQVRAIA